MYRIYVEVTLIHGKDSSIRPLSIKWEDGRVFEIDKLLDVRMASSLKAGGRGWRYTCLNQNQIAQIESYKEELHNLGYNSWDICRIIKDEIGISEISAMDDDQYDNLISELKSYIRFARKCRT